MTDPWYRVDVALMDPTHTIGWSLEHSAGQVTDDIRVLDNLTFGWSMPDTSLRPVQPNPMTASLAITVPEFADVEWVGEGVAVALEVTLDPDADPGSPAFAFYGRVTDAQAVPRVKRSGVTLSLTAVDYTIDPAEYEPYDQGDVYLDDDDVLTTLWASGGFPGGAFPDWPTTPSVVAITGTGGINPRDLIDQILLTAIDELPVPPELLLPGDVDPPGPGGVTDLGRLILAPVIDPATLMPFTSGASKHWAFDTVWRIPRTPGITIDASKLEKSSMVWGRNKRTPPNKVTATGPGPISSTASHVGGGRPYGPDVIEIINTVSADIARVGGIAIFYLTDLAPARRGWNLPTIRWLLTREDPADLAALPLDLMPRWKQPEGDYDRASCYGRLITLDGVVASRNPYDGTADESLIGLLSACQLTIAGGHIALDLGFRQLQEES